MAFNEDGRATSDEFRKRFAEMFRTAPPDHLGKDLRDVRAQLEAELEAAKQKVPNDYIDVSASRADVLRRAYTERHI